MPAGSKVPRVMQTTKERSNSSAPPEFNTLEYLGQVGEEEWAVKIYSDHKVSDEWLDNMFQGQVKWVTRKEVSRQRTIPSTTY
jgi:prenylcysteine oxidase/farnesylcysteine lyase